MEGESELLEKIFPHLQQIIVYTEYLGPDIPDWDFQGLPGLHVKKNKDLKRCVSTE